jgi:hypothetical protein
MHRCCQIDKLARAAREASSSRKKGRSSNVLDPIGAMSSRLSMYGLSHSLDNFGTPTAAAKEPVGQSAIPRHKFLAASMFHQRDVRVASHV